MIVKTINRIISNPIFNSIKEKNKSKIFIYPNWNGIGLGFFLFLCFLVAVFYEINFSLLLSIILFFIFFISIFISHQNLNNLSIHFLDHYFIEADKNTKIEFQIKNHSKDKKLNIEVDYENKNTGSFNLIEKSIFYKINYLIRERGTLNLSRIVLKSVYPFGIIRTKKYFENNSKLIIYPKSIQPTQDLLIEFNINIKSNTNSEFDGIEEYKYGDSFSKIAWKKSSIKNKKFVKNFEEPKSYNKSILNLNNYSDIPFELLLSYSTFIILYYFQNNFELTFKHNNLVFNLNKSQSSLNNLLKYLANVKNK